MKAFIQKNSLMTSVCLLIIPYLANASYYDVLPKGVRNLTYQLTQTGNINGRFTNSGNLQGYNINAKINADAIKGISTVVDTYLDTLSADDYKNFSFGTFRGNAKSNVSVQGLGGGYGLSNKLTLYGFIPFYSATVDLRISRTENSRTSTANSTIEIENVPNVDLRLIQSLFVNFYQYQPLGKWQADDFGDLEFGGLYQLKKWKNAGALISGGVVVPTGRTDDPDILQDIAFGDGQWDAFFEFGGGFQFGGKYSDISVDHWNRATYQFPFQSTVRLAESGLFPITDQKGVAKIKYGDKFQSNIQATLKSNDEWSFAMTYSLEYKVKDNYSSAKPLADLVLEENTERLSHTGKLSVDYSTINLFKRKKFFMPINLNLAVISIFAGKNTPKYERADFQIRMFF